MFESYQLANKTNVILVPQLDTKSVTVLVMYPVGSRYETNKLAGVSHYIEHLMFKGTKRRKNTLTLTREIDRLGAEYNAFTSKEYTGYYIKIDSEFTNTSLDILSDMLFHSSFDPKEMEREKGPIVEELRMYRDNPIMNIENIFEELMYDGSPLGRDIGGSDETVMSFKRDEVLAFRDKYYCAGNMTIVVAGRVTDETRVQIEKYFGVEPSGRTPSKTFKPFLLGDEKKDKRLAVQHKKTDQAQLMMGFPGFHYAAKENAAVTVLETILGGSMSSRLFIQIRERRGLAYMIRSGDEHFRDTGYLYIRAGLDAKNLNKALGVMLAEIEKMMEKPVTNRELADAKTHLHGALTLAMEDSSAQANWYGRQALFLERVQTPAERLREIDEVTAADIQAVARQVFHTSKMRVAIIGDVARDAVRY